VAVGDLTGGVWLYANPTQMAQQDLKTGTNGLRSKVLDLDVCALSVGAGMLLVTELVSWPRPIDPFGQVFLRTSLRLTLT
jgi:hypothetical protein